MKIIIIGAVAAGTSAGAKARRNNENADITIYEKEEHISYSGCGMPYFLGDKVDSISALNPRDPAFFKKKYNIDVKTGFEVLSVDSKEKEIVVKNLTTGEEFSEHYDKLVLATGAKARTLDISGTDREHVFYLRTMRNGIEIKEFLSKNSPKNAIIVGTGFIGFEVLENLLGLGISVTMLEQSSKITANLDEDMATYLEDFMKKNGIKLKKNTTLTKINSDNIELSTGETLPCDFVLLATGVVPNTNLAEKMGLTLGNSKAIVVSKKMETNIPDVYACGDCVETFSLIHGGAVYRPLGSTANKTGRIAGDVITGGNLEYKGNLSTGIFKFRDLSIASTGLSEKEAIECGYELEICHNIKPNKAEYLGGQEMVIKGIADKKTSRLLGVQIIGTEGVDKRIDVFATLISYKATVDELFHLDLAYAPPFSTTKDPVHYTGMILDNAINNGQGLLTTVDLEKMIESEEKIQIVDARSESDFANKGTVSGACNIPQGKLRDEDLPLDKEILTVTFCNKGVTGNAAQNILLNRGYKKVLNLSGGHKFYKITHKNK